MKTLEFGIIGLGHFGKHYVRLLSEVNGAHLKITANNSLSAEQLLQDPTVDCVIIASPSSTHGELILLAMEAGKHILVEKPMVTTSAEARSIRAALAERPLTLMVGFQFVYNDYIRYLRQMIEDQSLGKILYVLGEHLYPGPIRSDVGSLVDAGAHELSLLRYLFNPGTIQTAVGQSLTFGAAKHDDFTAVTVNFESGLSAHLVTSRFAPQKIRRFTIVGEKGSAVFDDLASENKLQIYERPYPPPRAELGTRSIFFDNQPSSRPEISASEPLRNELEGFIHCVRTGEPPITDAEFGSWVAEQSEIILKKVHQG